MLLLNYLLKCRPSIDIEHSIKGALRRLLHLWSESLQMELKFSFSPRAPSPAEVIAQSLLLTGRSSASLCTQRLVGDLVGLAFSTDRLQSRAGLTLRQPELGYSRQKKTYPGSIHGAVWERCVRRWGAENRTGSHISATSPWTAFASVVTKSDQI